jgi:hypothetical protein
MLEPMICCALGELEIFEIAYLVGIIEYNYDTVVNTVIYSNIFEYFMTSKQTIDIMQHIYL